MARYLFKIITLADDVKCGDRLVEPSWMVVDSDRLNQIDIFDKTYIHPVYCKDCKFYKQLDDACPYLGEDGYYKELPGEDDFCSRGERRE